MSKYQKKNKNNSILNFEYNRNVPRNVLQNINDKEDHETTDYSS